MKRKSKILVCGDAIIDINVYGQYEPISNDNVPQLIRINSNELAGGARLASYLTPFFDDNTTVRIFQPKPWPIKTRFYDSFCSPPKLIFRYDQEYYSSFNPSGILPQLNWQEFLGVLVSDYNKGFLDNKDTINYIGNFTLRENIPLVIDAKQPLEYYPGHAIVHINADYPHDGNDAKMKVVLTHGELPPEIYYPTGKTLRLKEKKKVPCVNHIGAGDCFSANLLCALIRGKNLEEAVDVADDAARIYVQHPREEIYKCEKN